MQQAVGARGEVDERAERRGLDDLAVVGLAGFRHVRVGDLVDDGLGLLGRFAAFGGDEHGTVILDGDLGAGVLLDLVDHLALRPDNLADLVDRNGGGDDARGVLAHLGRAVDALVDEVEDRGAGLVSLLQGTSQDIGRNAVKLGVELQGGDELGGAGDLEVHVAERVLGAQDVGERLEDVLAIDVTGDQTHRDTRDRGLQRHAGGEQRQRGGAHGAHRGGTVGTDGLGDLTDGVRELLAAWQHRHDGLLGEGAVADLAALRGADATGLTGGVRRHLVVVHVALGLRAGKRVDLLLHLEHVQRGDAQDLGLAALEQGGAVHARHDVHLGGQGADVAQATAVDAVVLGEDAAAHDLALQLLERVAEFLLLLGIVHVGELVREHLTHVLLDLVDAVLARQLLRDGQCLVGDLVDAGVQLVGVLGEQLEVLGLLGCLLLELVLGFTDHLDERLGGFETLRDDFLVRLDLALVVDEVPGVLAGTGFDHGDGDVTVLDDTAGDHDLEHSALALAPAREGDPLAVDQRQTHAGDRAFERQAGDHRRSGGRVQGDDVVGVVGIDGQHGLHDLHFVAQRVREQRAQRTVDDTARQDRLGARAAFTAEERARDLARGVHLLLHVDGQREEVVVLLRAGTGGGGGQNHRIIVKIGCHRAIRLLCETTRLEAQGSFSERTIVNNGLHGLDFGTLHRVPPFFVLLSADICNPHRDAEIPICSSLSAFLIDAARPGPHPFIPDSSSSSALNRRATVCHPRIRNILIHMPICKTPEQGMPGRKFSYRRRPRRSIRER